MNIFVTSPDPSECAEVLDDVRLRKMIVETGQILSAVFHLEPIMFPSKHDPSKFYKPTHLRHPVVQWAKANSLNLGWSRDHFHWLHEEYLSRFKKVHKTYLRLWPQVQFCGANAYPGIDFCKCNPYTHIRNVFVSYRFTLLDKWKADTEAGRPPKWTNRHPPQWWKE